MDEQDLDDEDLDRQLARVTAELARLRARVHVLETQEETFKQRVQMKDVSNRLPFDILALIFAQVVDLQRTSMSIGPLLHVSHSWYRACIGHPSLWTVIGFHAPFRTLHLEKYKLFFNACIQRSGILSFDVIFSAAHMDIAAKECWEMQSAMDALDPDYNTMPTRICSHERPRCVFWRSQARTAVAVLSFLQKQPRARWQSFHFDWPHRTLLEVIRCPEFSWSLLDTIIEGRFGLESLFIGNGGHDFATTTRLDPSMCNLRRIELVDQSWETAIADVRALPNVRELLLEWKDEGDWASIGMRRLGDTWLCKFPNLEELTLRTRKTLTYPKVWDVIPTQSGPVQALSLKKLTLIGRVPSRVLQTFQTPQLQTLVIAANDSRWTSAPAVNRLKVGADARCLELLDLPADVMTPWRDLQQLFESMDHLEEVRVSRPLFALMLAMCFRHHQDIMLTEDRIEHRGRDEIFVCRNSLDNVRELLQQLGS